MKKIGKTFALLACAIPLWLGFVACSNDDDDSGKSLAAAPEKIPEGYMRVNLKGDADYLYIWGDWDVTELAKASWPKGPSFCYSNGSFIAVDVKLAANPSTVNMIATKSDGTKVTGKSDIVFKFPGRYNEIFLKADDETVYVKDDLTTQASGLASASLTSDTVIAITGNVTLSEDTVTLTDKNGSAVAVSAYGTDTLMLASSIKASYTTIAPLTLSVKSGSETDTVVVSLESSLVESWFGSSAEAAIKNSAVKLGVTVNGASATFKTWAPLASSVKLLLFADSASLSKDPASIIDMVAGANGFWTAENVSFGSNKYYKYRIANGVASRDVSDIWAYVASGDSVASQIADIDDADATPADWESGYTNPFGATGAETKRYNDAVIYEMHIRDWSRAEVNNSTGKFLEIANAKSIINHLKDLGVTHVQILPMFDYAQTNDDENYNWGYNPYHYNVPEGRYVTQGYKDGTQAVKEMRTMIKALHDAGIAVIMDVVYNHTNGTGTGSLYDMTVPEYFYRMTSDGNYYNGSGCGNEVATNHAMVKYYVIDSLKHWMKDYHINGFRFDLMGLLEASTMKAIYDELYAIDKNVLVYGEPWTGGTSGVSSGAEKAGKGTNTNGWGYGAFDDSFRDAIKGGVYGGFQLGQVQGKNKDKAIIAGLTGATCDRNDTNITGLSLHYIECHDNYTLFDKLVYSMLGSAVIGKDAIASQFAAAYKSVMQNSDKLAMLKKRDKLAAAYVLLSQGTPFINGGQEFLRTKKGDPDSYAADTKGGITWTNTAGEYNIDDVNQIDLAMAKTHSDVYNTYKALIKIRKDIDAFTNTEVSYADASTESEFVTKYTVYDSEGTQYVVYFNANESDYTLKAEVNAKPFTIDETNGTYSVASSASAVSSVPAMSFVILKK